jgi:hypothetical protein
MRVRRVVGFLTIAFVAGCSSIQRVPVAYIADEQPSVVYLINSYGIVTSVQYPRLSGDTVYGSALGQDRKVAVPLTQVEGISTMKFDRARTVVLVAGGVGVVALGAWAMFGGSSGDHNITCDYTTRALEQNGGAPICTQR